MEVWASVKYTHKMNKRLACPPVKQLRDQVMVTGGLWVCLYYFIVGGNLHGNAQRHAIGYRNRRNTRGMWGSGAEVIKQAQGVMMGAELRK